MFDPQWLGGEIPAKAKRWLIWATYDWNGSQFGGNGTSSQNGQVSGSSSSPLRSSIHSTPMKNQNHHFDAAKLPTTFGPALG
ncbi:hypothetical protein N7501_003893 [Penicillium viridicatum]|nr:hypothetical protein N7501_003893 [Penicillium viridicatum]